MSANAVAHLAPVLRGEGGVVQRCGPSLVIVGAQKRCLGSAASDSCDLKV